MWSQLCLIFPRENEQQQLQQTTGRQQESLLKQHVVKVYHLHPTNSVYRFKPDPTAPSPGETQAFSSRWCPFIYSIALIQLLMSNYGTQGQVLKTNQKKTTKTKPVRTVPTLHHDKGVLNWGSTGILQVALLEGFMQQNLSVKQSSVLTPLCLSLLG